MLDVLSISAECFRQGHRGYEGLQKRLFPSVPCGTLQEPQQTCSTRRWFASQHLVVDLQSKLECRLAV